MKLFVLMFILSSCSICKTSNILDVKEQIKCNNELNCTKACENNFGVYSYSYSNCECTDGYKPY